MAIAHSNAKPRLKRSEIAGPVTSRKSELGQFLTPPSIAAFMAAMFPPPQTEAVSLLDAGAGQGALTAALLKRLCELQIPNVATVAYELDSDMLVQLKHELARFSWADVKIVHGDFIELAVGNIGANTPPTFSHAILNPPYRKITTASAHRHLLRRVGIETVNLYSAFVGLALLLLKPGGHLCAIIPRSFCNGPYYRPFRELVLREAALQRVHVFKARNKAFAHDAVLQENVIVLLQRSAPQGDVELSASTDGTFTDLETRMLPFKTVVRDNNNERMFYLPASDDSPNIPGAFNRTLDDLGIKVSTGPVVDFRLIEHLHKVPTADTVPLVYPSHFGPAGYSWPYGNPKKASSIARNAETEKWLFPAGNYTVVRRLSSKEERRRIVANVVPEESIRAERIGFENHLNVFHRARMGLPKHFALGLMVYLNSSMLDAHFRAFNGHTQVNATDLRALPYPDEARLLEMGSWAAEADDLSQSAIDEYMERMA